MTIRKKTSLNLLPVSSSNRMVVLGLGLALLCFGGQVSAQIDPIKVPIQGVPPLDQEDPKKKPVKPEAKPDVKPDVKQDQKQEQGRLAPPQKQSKDDQEQELADEYFRRDEWAKAAEIYKNLTKRKERLVPNYRKYAQCLTQLTQWDELERLIKRVSKQEDKIPTYAVDLALFYQNHKQTEKAQSTIDDLTKRIKLNQEAVNMAAEYALEKGQPNWSKQLYESAREALKQPELFADQMAKVFQALGDNNRMFDEILGFVEQQNQPMFFVQATLQNLITKPEEYTALEKILLNKLSANPMSNPLTELLLWVYLQQKDFTSAFIQARALDRRNSQEGQKCMEIAWLASQNKEYQTAIRIYDYVIQTWPQTMTSFTAQRQQLLMREQVLKMTWPVDKPEVRKLIADYRKLNEARQLPSYNRYENLRTIGQLYGFYLDRQDTAIMVLENLIKQPAVNQELLDKSKIDLADFYLLDNQPWEATLLYSQVEKSQRENVLGHEAKLRNARLNYFKGEFMLAQEHLDVLKIATTREISNDAIELSLRIQNNTVLDSASPALYAFSKVELLLFQNKVDQALKQMADMIKQYPQDPIQDDIHWVRATTYRKMKEFQLAIADLEVILAKHGDDVYGDDAQFSLGQIYESDLGDKTKAMEAYEQVLKKYPTSIFAAEARKRFRQLRGDNL